MPSYAFFRKQYVPLAEAKVGVMTHAFNYGTGCFEGIRGNWNADEGKCYVFRLKEHYQRFLKSCRILKMALPYSVDDLCQMTVRLVEMSGFREDVYIRPIGYKSSEIVGVKLHDLEDDIVVFVVPFGPYLEGDKGIRCCTSSWRRIDDTSIPARAKITGIYVNSALAKTEAHDNGYDEAIMLTHDGHVSEGSGENIFIATNGNLITPPSSDNILMGITRDTVIKLAKDELGISTIERSVDRSELYTADECFMTGTAAHITPVVEVDHRKIGDGRIGRLTEKLQALYFDVIKGKNKRYINWCTPVPSKVMKV